MAHPNIKQFLGEIKNKKGQQGMGIMIISPNPQELGPRCIPLLDIPGKVIDDLISKYYKEAK